ncbi:phosphodiesterase [Azospirillum rugosum]|uniref:3',5'-cyclic AMP phosphodiesterase CpdA n=1 Tax=Azospirillum rugosum TaxID=416170 RepID=A0ABS4SQH6_9PROT|nr:phosphodiesterase [Azospirillum rugosum]MBP2294469.1 3',5'-cyclic AMP phosphodiesterase CpdA [Azospirillum rugosum]MDQ0528974.1 3',5'-cyclic AMP phosphodiesterase CpdA [Azospirillum rugosum]
MLIAQISDLHVVAPGSTPTTAYDTNARLAAAVAHLNALDPRPDLVLITGDLINGPKPGEYEALAEILAPLAIPYRVLAGNHDDRDGLRRSFAGTGWMPMANEDIQGDFIQYAVEEFPVRVLMLDSVVAGSPVGALCERRLAWTAERLAEQPERPTIIALHHPPFDTGLAFLDTLRCVEGAEELGRLVRSSPNVLAVLSGHTHRQTALNWNGAYGYVAPSIAYQIALDLTPEPPYRWTEEPSALALHLYRPGAGLITHLSPIGGYPAKDFSRKARNS